MMLCFKINKTAFPLSPDATESRPVRPCTLCFLPALGIAESYCGPPSFGWQSIMAVTSDCIASTTKRGYTTDQECLHS